MTPGIKKTKFRARDAAATEVDYTFPERIVVDAATYAELQGRIQHPRQPNAALRALFKK